MAHDSISAVVILRHPVWQVQAESVMVGTGMCGHEHGTVTWFRNTQSGAGPQAAPPERVGLQDGPVRCFVIVGQELVGVGQLVGGMIS
jgi:hypothetical protein